LIALTGLLASAGGTGADVAACASKVDPLAAPGRLMPVPAGREAMTLASKASSPPREPAKSGMDTGAGEEARPPGAIIPPAADAAPVALKEKSGATRALGAEVADREDELPSEDAWEKAETPDSADGLDGEARNPADAVGSMETALTKRGLKPGGADLGAVRFGTLSVDAPMSAASKSPRVRVKEPTLEEAFESSASPDENEENLAESIIQIERNEALLPQTAFPFLPGKSGEGENPNPKIFV
jgi:hypothetical protein